MTRLLIDGYNVAHKLGLKISRDNLEQVRISLEQKLSRYLAEKKCSITLVYDGRGILENQSSVGKLKILYTPGGETADARIKKLIDAERSKSALTVVSSDHEVAGYARVSGVRCLSSEAFTRELSLSSDPKAAHGSAGKPVEPDAGAEKPAMNATDLAKWKTLFGE
ncbi:MAG: NYN domain-containing protein [Rhizobacter sp.]|nr:NYN domain-containing protein [Chlorobiales bacterium]